MPHHYMIDEINEVYYSGESKKFCNIWVVCAHFQHVYHVTEVVQAMDGTGIMKGLSGLRLIIGIV